MKPSGDFKSRHKLIRISFHSLFFIILLRVTYIQLFPGSEDLLSHLANKQYQSVIELHPYRGTIYDHRYIPLAISIKTPSVAVNPKVFNPSKENRKKLAKLLDLPEPKIRALSDKDSYFAWLKRKIPWELSEMIRKMNLKGMHFLSEHSRYYTGGEDAAHLLGYVGTDNTGLLGLEHSQNMILKGQATTIISLKDARGEQILLNNRDIRPGRSGKNLILTIDRVIQEISEKALKRAIKKSGSKAGFVLVSDPHTGRILAMASRPGFNPNDPGSISMSKTKNLALSWAFEPGSTLKPFVIAAAIEQKLTSPFEIHNCEKSGRLPIDRFNSIHDDHPREFATTEEILIYSSNICTFKIAQRLKEEGLYKTLKNFGFSGRSTLIDVPGHVSGYMSPWKKWKPIRFANISFGQGMLVTGLEVIQAYGAIANGGYLISPYVIERTESERGVILDDYGPAVRQKVLSAETARAVSRILKKVTEEGTAQKAQMDHYTAAGKTGTAEKPDPESRAYSKEKRIANFAGFTPANRPHLVIYVVLDEPGNKPYYGGMWAAPAFREIAQESLQYLNVEPDKETLSSR